MIEERARRTLEHGWPTSPRAFYKAVRTQRAGDVEMAERDFTSAGHLIANLARIASIGVLNAVPGDNVPESALRGAISIRDVLSQPGVTYFSLPAQLEPTSALFVAKMFVHLLCAVAKVYHGPRVPVLIFADEFQEMVSPDLATPLRQARDSGITTWMGFQDLAALRTAQGDFAPALLANAALKIFCSAEDQLSRDYLVRVSGETTRVRESVTDTVTNAANGTTRGTAVQRREETVPRVDPEKINRVNRDPRASLVIASEAVGYTRFRFPVVVWSGFHISRREFERRQAMPWPKGNRYTVIVEPTRPVEVPPPVAPPPASAPPDVPEPSSPEASANGQATPEAPPEPTPPRRRGRPRKARREEETPKPPAGVEGVGDMAEYLKKLAGEVTPDSEASEGGER
jgi:hypothetical protein